MMMKKAAKLGWAGPRAGQEQGWSKARAGLKHEQGRSKAGTGQEQGRRVVFFDLFQPPCKISLARVGREQGRIREGAELEKQG